MGKKKHHFVPIAMLLLACRTHNSLCSLHRSNAVILFLAGIWGSLVGRFQWFCSVSPSTSVVIGALVQAVGIHAGELAIEAAFHALHVFRECADVVTTVTAAGFRLERSLEMNLISEQCAVLLLVTSIFSVEDCHVQLHGVDVCVERLDVLEDCLIGTTGATAVHCLSLIDFGLPVGLEFGPASSRRFRFHVPFLLGLESILAALFLELCKGLVHGLLWSEWLLHQCCVRNGILNVHEMDFDWLLWVMQDIEHLFNLIHATAFVATLRAGCSEVVNEVLGSLGCWQHPILAEVQEHDLAKPMDKFLLSFLHEVIAETEDVELVVVCHLFLAVMICFLWWFGWDDHSPNAFTALSFLGGFNDPGVSVDARCFDLTRDFGMAAARILRAFPMLMGFGFCPSHGQSSVSRAGSSLTVREVNTTGASACGSNLWFPKWRMASRSFGGVSSVTFAPAEVRGPVLDSSVISCVPAVPGARS